MDDIDRAAAALADAVLADPSFAADPPRLGRALLDLSPYDRLNRLLVLAAELGVPALTSAGALAEARDVLRYDAGLRFGVANWVVAAWAATGPQAGDPVTAVRSGDPPGVEEEEDTLAEDPGRPTTIRLGAGPDGRPVVAAISPSGVFVTSPDGSLSPVPVSWRRVATPHAPTSRDVSTVLGGGRDLIVVSTELGLTVRSLSCVDTDTTPSGVRVGEPQLLVPAGGEEPRYPLVALAPDDSSVEVLWTADRRRLRRALIRDWLPGVASGTVSSPCGPRERLTALHLAGGSPGPAWLLAITDEGTPQVARWEVELESVGPWHPLHPPVPIAAASIVLLDGVPIALAGNDDGHLISTEVGAAGGVRESWHSVDAPAELPHPGPIRLLAAAGSGPGASGWLAVSGTNRSWLAPLRRVDDRVVAGPRGVLLPGLTAF
jgi:hypothetical protein